MESHSSMEQQFLKKLIEIIDANLHSEQFGVTELAEELGMKVEVRPVPVEELSTFEETGACGTAAVISPISRIDDFDENKSYIFSKDGKPGPISEKLYNKLRAIQYGDEADKYGWVTVV